MIQTFDTRPLIEANENSVITFAGKADQIRVYDFDFKSFANENLYFELDTPLKNKSDGFDDRMSTNDDDEDLNLLVSLMRVPAKTQRRNSFSVNPKIPFEFEFLNSKRNFSDFHSEMNDEKASQSNKRFDYCSDKNERAKCQVFDDSIDEAIMANNMSFISFDDDIVTEVHKKRKIVSNKIACQSKKVKLSLEC